MKEGAGSKKNRHKSREALTDDSKEDGRAMVLNKENATIGVIGMGDMGAMYAQRLSMAGWR